MTFADTSEINLKVLLDSKDEATALIRKFVRVHLKDQSEMTDAVKNRLKKTNIRTQYLGLAMFYQQKIVPYYENKMKKEAQQEIEKKWRAAGKEPYYKSARTNAWNEQADFRKEVDKLIEKRKKTHEEYWRATKEQTRLSSADNILKGGPVESDLPSGLDIGGDEDAPENPNPNDNPQPETPRPKTPRPDNPRPDENAKIPRPGGGRCPGEFCSGVKKSFSWNKHPRSNKWYCQDCWKGMFPGEKPKDDNRGPDTPPPPKNPLQDEINKAIAEIQDALNDDPQVSASELGPRFRGYTSFLKTFKQPWQIGQLKDFKSQMIAEIKAKRAEKKKKWRYQRPLGGL